MTEQSKRKHIVVDDVIHKLLKIRAAQDEKDMQELANEILKKELLE